MAVMALDIGTTHCKAAILDREGFLLASHAEDTPTRCSRDGQPYYDAEEVFQMLLSLMRRTCRTVPDRIGTIAVAGMAEAGLFVDLRSGLAVTHIIPWFDMRTMAVFQEMRDRTDDYERFTRTGLRNNFKYSVYKMQWLLRNANLSTHDLIWLSVPDYIAYRLTGCFGTDYSLAARTYLFDIFELRYVDEYLAQAGLQDIRLPQSTPSGSPIGTISRSLVLHEGLEPLSQDTKVAICGHDHLCAAVAAGATTPGVIYDSMGTAEILLGSVKLHRLGRPEYETGFLFGRHLIGEYLHWMGSTPASGDSVEWARHLVGSEADTYATLMALLERAQPGPTGIVYLPYLSGSSAPVFNPGMTGGFLGLRKQHGKAEILKAVLEGVSYDLEWIRQQAAACFGTGTDAILCVGGGTRNAHWMQIKADLSGCEIQSLQLPEATLTGAARIAASRCGDILPPLILAGTAGKDGKFSYHPDAERHEEYQQIFRTRYLPVQEPLRRIFGSVGVDPTEQNATD